MDLVTFGRRLLRPPPPRPSSSLGRGGLPRARRGPTRRLDVREDASASRAVLDHGGAVLRAVKVLGFDSVNRRRYTREAARAAIGMYEGAKVNLDHPQGPPGQTRGVRDRFGWLENVRVESDGLWADLRYNPQHEYSESFRWWAEHQPDALGLSHNAVGQGHDEEGIFVVDKIVVVRSVDLVADPATTRGLHESRGRTNVSWIEYPRRRRRLAYLREEASHMAALRDGFAAAAEHLIDLALDGAIDPQEALRKLKVLLSHHEAIRDQHREEEEEDAGELARAHSRGPSPDEGRRGPFAGEPLARPLRKHFRADADESVGRPYRGFATRDVQEFAARLRRAGAGRWW